ncbi:hypothetical protein V6N12_000324 [Hibiscus sabdariffa]|uniref:Uncharacterized protein n=1 Tax=Hibiscus sabdariffa TaxID=183260 RepID=A0ABR2APB4_9ROSI
MHCTPELQQILTKEPPSNASLILFRIRIVYSDYKHLRFLFPRYLIGKSRQSSQVSGEDGYSVYFMSKLMGNGSSKLRTDAYSGSDASSRDGACHPAHL